MTREEKVQKIKEKILKEIEIERKDFFDEDGNVAKVAPSDTKRQILYIAALYYIEDYIKSPIAFVDQYKNGEYVMPDRILNVLLNDNFDVLNAILCAIEVANKELIMDTYKDTFYYIPRFMNDGYFCSEIVSTIDVCLYGK